jgi:hypothetical protein
LETGEDFFGGPNPQKISVKSMAAETIRLQAETYGPRCRWTILVDYIISAGRRQLSVRPMNGDPFELGGVFSRTSPDDYPLINWRSYSDIYYFPLLCPTGRCIGAAFIHVSGDQRERRSNELGVPLCPTIGHH